MSHPVISVENLSKSYRLGQIGTGTLSRDLKVWWARTRGKPNPLLRIGQTDNSHRDGEILWALKDVSFQVGQGEVLGIIGRNGAGKSTLLKILSRVTAPTSGCVKVKGRIASLLEVGTGFHPELTGRENIYLNGAILGMTREEVRRKFDEIVAFAEIEKFIDTPVKRYSSGMYVRLAFAVAAHLESEILLVDEVLAVGDAEFQKKCLGKMGEVAKQGRTVVFVSHNMPSINRLCSRALWISSGNIKISGITNQVVSTYLSQNAIYDCERSWNNIDTAPGNHKLRLLSLRVLNNQGVVSPTLDIQKSFSVVIDYKILLDIPSMRIAFVLSDSDGVDIFASVDTLNSSWENSPRLKGFYTSKVLIPGDLLKAGKYLIRFSAEIPFVEMLFMLENEIGFEIVDTGGVSSRFPEKWPGIICPRLEWSISRNS